MKDKSDAAKVKKPIYKKWWFWAIVVVILVAASGSQGTEDESEVGVNDDNSLADHQIEDATTKKFIEEIKTTIQGAIGSEDESITDITLKSGDLCITVDLSRANPEPLTLQDLAISRAGSITDKILTLDDYDGQWNTITIDFGDIGKITNGKESVKENEVGGRYFPSEDFILE